MTGATEASASCLALPSPKEEIVTPSLERAQGGASEPFRRKQLVHYVRYMDDLVLLARTRWGLRRAIAALHEEIAPLGLRLHRVKRFIGRTTRGFDFLGYRIRAGARLRPSAEGLRRLRERARRLHKREGGIRRLRQYVLRWWWWFLGGLDGMVSRKGGLRRIERLVFRGLDIHPRRGTVTPSGA